MPEFSKHPTVTFIIATLNSGSVLINCLQSIKDQNYPSTKINIFIIDGGSTDSTLKIAKLYQAKVFHTTQNRRISQSIGYWQSQHRFYCLIDSDNILPDPDWLNTMLFPLISDNTIIGSEPWSFTYRKNGGFIERYCSLTGVNDPFTLIAKNYDRQNTLSGNWTGLNLNIVDHQYYQSIRLVQGSSLPTIGANGTIYRTNFLKKYFSDNYFFDIDFIPNTLSKLKTLVFAKVKVGIVHTYCESSITKFYKKQLRRATDLYIYHHQRTDLLIKKHTLPSLYFTLYVISVLPVIYDTIRGYTKKPDMAWFFHPLACIITLYVYGIQTIKYKLGLLKPLNRKKWHQ
jgi:glycosyltransferase involved in cell wall biosynthesis